MAIENGHRNTVVDLPSYKMGISHSFLYVYQRVNHLMMMMIFRFPTFQSTFSPQKSQLSRENVRVEAIRSLGKMGCPQTLHKRM